MDMYALDVVTLSAARLSSVGLEEEKPGLYLEDHPRTDVSAYPPVI